MKKLLLAVLAVAFVSSICFAQPAPAPATPSAPKPAPEVKTFTGKVDSIMMGDAAKGTKSEITVLDDKGQKLTVIVKAGASILSKEGKAITLSELKKDDQVVIAYITKAGGTQRAQSIKVQ